MNKLGIFFGVLALCFVVQISSCSGGNVGYVNLTIMPSPPYISSLEILQQEDFNYLECDAQIMGNNPSDYNTIYTWNAGGVKVGEGERVEVRDNWKEITCKAEAYDSNNGKDIKEKTIIIVRHSITGNAVSKEGGANNLFLGAILFVSIALFLFVSRTLGKNQILENKVFLCLKDAVFAKFLTS
ncbi:MAG: hypothetical protein V1660_03850 [archaeon]